MSNPTPSALDLTPANAAIMHKGSVEKVRVMFQRDFTPSTVEIATLLPFFVNDLIMAEEYPHLVLSKEEAVRRAQERYDLILDAIKESAIRDIKCHRGEWIAVA